MFIGITVALPTSSLLKLKKFNTFSTLGFGVVSNKIVEFEFLIISEIII